MVTRRGWLLFVGMCVLWGIPYFLIRIAVHELTPALLVLARTAIGAVVLVPLAVSRGQLRPLLPRWRLVGVYTLVEIAVPWVLLSHAETRISSSLAGLLVAGTPLFGALIALGIRLDDRLEPRRLGGLIAGFLGVMVLVGFDLGAHDLLAALEVLLVAVLYATGATLIGTKLRDLPSLGVIAASLGLAALVYAPIGLTELPTRMPSVAALSAITVLGLVCTVVAFLVFFALIAEVGPSRATVFTYVNPAVAVLLGVAFLHERFDISTAVGCVLILGGSFLATRPPATGRAGLPVAAPEVGQGGL